MCFLPCRFLSDGNAETALKQLVSAVRTEYTWESGQYRP